MYVFVMVFRGVKDAAVFCLFFFLCFFFFIILKFELSKSESSFFF